MKYNCFVIGLTCLTSAVANGQTSPLYNNLPVGKYDVGFKIVTFIDSSRVTKPLYNYFGEKETGDRYQKITVHIWYPAKANKDKEKLTYGDYCYNHLQSTTFAAIDKETKENGITAMRNSFENFFGKISDDNWQQVISTKMLAQNEAESLREKFPLLIGQLRPLSTSITNELMASNGYVVGMVVNNGGRIPLSYINEVADLQQTIAYINKTRSIDENNIGTYGFSGSGFSQVLLAMNDPRVAALADIESALYGEGIWQLFSSSNYYDISKLRIPFLHIYGKYLGRSDVKFDEFYNTKYSERYHLLLNQYRLHHWDVATEGRASTTVLHVRGDLEPGVKASFELSNIYLLHFFNAVLKKMPESKKNLDTKSAVTGYHDSLWTFQQYPALQPPPDRLQFEEVIKRKGIDEAIQLVRHFRKVDSAAAFIHQNALNQTSRVLRDQGELKDAITLMQLAVELHPAEAWLWLNLSDMQEAGGDIPGAIQSCEKVMDVLKDFAGLEQSFNGRIRRSAQGTLKRLKKE